MIGLMAPVHGTFHWISSASSLKSLMEIILSTSNTTRGLSDSYVLSIESCFELLSLLRQGRRTLCDTSYFHTDD